MPTNFYIFFLTGLIPLIVGAIYYHKNVLGNVWQKTNNFTDEYIAAGNMPLIFGLTYLFSILLSFFLSSLVIHQGAVFSMMMPDVMESGSEVQQQFNDLMAQFGDRHRSFSHGAVHGVFVTIFFVLPIITINALFERRGWEYILVHAGYWAISLALMGGVIGATLKYAPMG